MHHIRDMKDLNPKLSYMDREMVRKKKGGSYVEFAT